MSERGARLEAMLEERDYLRIQISLEPDLPGRSPEEFRAMQARIAQLDMELARNSTIQKTEANCCSNGL